MELSKIIKENCNLDYSQEIAELMFHEEYYIEKLKKNRLLKEDKEKLIEALQIIRLGESHQ